MNGTAPGLRFPPGSWSCSFATSRWSGSSFFTLADFVTLINPISGPGYDLPQPVLLASLAFSRRPGCQRKRAEFCTVFGRIRKTAPQAHVGPVVAATAGARPRPTSEGIETQHLRFSRTARRSSADWKPDLAPPPRGLKLSKKALSRACQMDQPDPAPPQRGLKPAGRDLLHGLLHVPGARPRPTSVGIETRFAPMSCRTSSIASPPPPPWGLKLKT